MAGVSVGQELTAMERRVCYPIRTVGLVVPGVVCLCAGMCVYVCVCACVCITHQVL